MTKMLKFLFIPFGESRSYIVHEKKYQHFVAQDKTGLSAKAEIGHS